MIFIGRTAYRVNSVILLLLGDIVAILTAIAHLAHRVLRSVALTQAVTSLGLINVVFRLEAPLINRGELELVTGGKEASGGCLLR